MAGAGRGAAGDGGVKAEEYPFEAALAALAWQVELGADEAVGEMSIDRFGVAERAAQPDARQRAPVPAAPAAPPGREAVLRGAAEIAEACTDIEELREALAGFEGSRLKKGARNLVFADGMAGARVMVVGEAPGREEDAVGRPFVGRSGQLLDRMFAAIGLARTARSRDAALYITNVLPWRPPTNRDPAADEVELLKPFLFRHIELARPEILVAAGATAARVILERTEGITRLRGRWAEWRGVPVMPMVHPASLLRDSSRKRGAWADLLAVRERLDGGGSQ